MSATIEPPLAKAIALASREQRLWMIQLLLPRVIESSGPGPIALEDEMGKPLGVFFPNYKSATTALPPVTPELEAEFARRMQTPEDCVDAEEFVKLVESEVARLSKSP